MKLKRTSIIICISAVFGICFTSCISLRDDSGFSTEMAVYGAITSSVQSIEKASETITPEEEESYRKIIDTVIGSEYQKKYDDNYIVSFEPQVHQRYQRDLRRISGWRRYGNKTCNAYI